MQQIALYFFVSFIFMSFLFLLIYAAGFPVAPHSYFHFFLLRDFQVSMTESCDEDVEEVGVDDVEERRSTRDNEYVALFDVLQSVFLPFFLVRCGLRPLVQW